MLDFDLILGHMMSMQIKLTVLYIKYMIQDRDRGQSHLYIKIIQLITQILMPIPLLPIPCDPHEILRCLHQLV